jgi:hypothetical protein
MKFGCVAAVVALLLIGSLPHFASGETKSGPVKLSESHFGAPDGAPAVEMGKKVRLTAKFVISDFFGSKVINAGAKLNNTAAAPMFFAFHVAFFDKGNHLLGCVSQNSIGDQGLKPGEETQLGSLLISLPASELKNVASYQTTFYESEHKL